MLLPQPSFCRAQGIILLIWGMWQPFENTTRWSWKSVPVTGDGCTYGHHNLRLPCPGFLNKYIGRVLWNGNADSALSYPFFHPKQRLPFLHLSKYCHLCYMDSYTMFYTFFFLPNEQMKRLPKGEVDYPPPFHLHWSVFTITFAKSTEGGWMTCPVSTRIAGTVALIFWAAL